MNYKILIIYMMIFITARSYSQNNIIMGTDDEYLGADEKKIECSKYLKDKTGIDYKPYNAYDGDAKTAWCVANSGIGEWIKFYFDEGPQYIKEVLKGKRNVYRVLIKNGLTVNKNMYFQNNRIKKLMAEFENGKKIIINLKDGNLEYQVFKFNIRSKWLKLTILDIYKGSKYNDTCISDITFRTIYDLSPEEIKEYKHTK